MKPSLGTCMICRKNNIKVRYINLYVIGSEGLIVCLECELDIINHIRDRISAFSKKRKKEYLQRKIKRLAGD